MTKPVGERVATLETEVKNLSAGVSSLADTVKQGMGELREELATQSLNGRTAKAKALVDDVGDEQSRSTLVTLIRDHDRRQWLARPILRGLGAAALVVFGVAAGHFLS